MIPKLFWRVLAPIVVVIIGWMAFCLIVAPKPHSKEKMRRVRFRVTVPVLLIPYVLALVSALVAALVAATTAPARGFPLVICLILPIVVVCDGRLMWLTADPVEENLMPIVYGLGLAIAFFWEVGAVLSNLFGDSPDAGTPLQHAKLLVFQRYFLTLLVVLQLIPAIVALCRPKRSEPRDTS